MKRHARAAASLQRRRYSSAQLYTRRRGALHARRASSRRRAAAPLRAQRPGERRLRRRRAARTQCKYSALEAAAWSRVRRGVAESQPLIAASLDYRPLPAGAVGASAAQQRAAQAATADVVSRGAAARVRAGGAAWHGHYRKMGCVDRTVQPRPRDGRPARGAGVQLSAHHAGPLRRAGRQGCRDPCCAEANAHRGKALPCAPLNPASACSEGYHRARTRHRGRHMALGRARLYP